MLGSETLKRKITLRDERIFKMNIQLCSRTKKPRNFSESFIFLTIACSVCTSILHIFLQLYTNLFDIIDNRTILSSLYIAFKNLSLLKMLKTGGSTINLYLLFILHLRLFYLYLHKQNKNYSSTQGRWCNGNRKCQKKKKSNKCSLYTCFMPGPLLSPGDTATGDTETHAVRYILATRAILIQVVKADFSYEQGLTCCLKGKRSKSNEEM